MGQSHPLVGWMDCEKSWRASLTEQRRLGSIWTSVDGWAAPVRDTGPATPLNRKLKAARLPVPFSTRDLELGPDCTFRSGRR